AKVAEHLNKSISVYGLSPYGMNNNALGNSASFKLPSGVIKGYIDVIQLGSADVQFKGWACSEGVYASVGVHVYVVEANGAKTFVGSSRATLANESAVNGICKNGYGNNRYSVSIPKSKLSAHRGKKVMIYGISPVGLSNNSLSRSGIL